MQETYLCKTDLGEIEVGRPVLTQAVLKAFASMDGLVWVTNKKGKMPAEGNRFSKEDAVESMEIEQTGDTFRLRIHLAVKFGISMQQTTDQLGEKIRKILLKEVGAAPSTILMHVTGTVAKRVAPRDIEYRIDYED